MWKNKIGRKGLSDKPSFGLKGVSTVYAVEGLNVNVLVNRLAKDGVEVQGLKKIGKNRAEITIKSSENKKFFAISKDLCYNIKKIRDRGILSPLLFLFRNIGLVVGCLSFVAAGVVSDDFIFGFTFSGTGSAYKAEIEQYLDERGVTVYSRFSRVDLDALADDILRVSPNMSFVACSKKGNRLQIELALKETDTSTLDGTVQKLESDVDGVVEKIKVYRGTPLVNAGDSVRAGDLLVDGYAEVKEQIVKINVLAYVTIRTQATFEYTSLGENDGKKAVLFALAEAEGEEKNCTAVVCKKVGDKYVYTVTLEFLHTLYAG